MHTLIILDGPPYGTGRGYNALRLAVPLLKSDPQGSVVIFLMADAVLCAKNGQKRANLAAGAADSSMRATFTPASGSRTSSNESDSARAQVGYNFR